MMISEVSNTWSKSALTSVVEEKHTDDDGIAHFFTYDAPIAADHAIRLAEHAAKILEQLQNDEAEALLNG